MKCSYGLSSRLPSYRKYFSCSYTCFNKNVVDICEPDSDFEDTFLINKVVQEKLIEAISISSLSEQIMNVFENSHLDDAMALSKGKKKKMKRRKKMRQKPRQKCDIIKEDEIQERPNLSLFERKLSIGEMTDCSSFFMNYPRRCFDNTSYSHITSEKDSVYSDDRLPPKRLVVRKRKKIQRRKKRRATPTPTTRANCFNIDRISINSSELDVIDISGSAKNLACSYDDEVVTEQNTKIVKNGALSNNEDCDKLVEALPIYKSTNTTDNEESSKIIGVVTTVVARDAKIIVTGATTAHDADLNNKYKDLKLADSTYNVNTDKIRDPYSTKPRKSIEDEKFSKEQRRQLRRKMRNVKKRPESYVVLGLI